MRSLLLALIACAASLLLSSGDATARRLKRPEVLYIWAGDAARAAPDFLAVVNFNDESPNYGNVIRTVPLPAPGDIGNEPHHVRLSADKNILAAGGLLSLLRGQSSVFFFDVSRPLHPALVKSSNAPLSGITDDFYPLASGGFLVTQMGSAEGTAPGRIAEYDANLQLVGEWPVDPPLDGFNPHGISVRPDLNLMVTTDFINPVTTLNIVPDQILFRGSVRVWDLAARAIVRTVQIPTAIGLMDIKLIPNDRRGRAYTFGMYDGLLYLIDTTAGTSETVFDMAAVVGGIDRPTIAMPQIMAMNERGDRLFVSVYAQGKIAMLDTSRPAQPELLDVLDLGPGSGPHYIHLTDDGRRLVVSDYFLDQDDFGKVKFGGDRKVQVVKVGRNRMKLDPSFSLDFKTAFATGPARPHGMEVK